MPCEVNCFPHPAQVFMFVDAIPESKYTDKGANDTDNKIQGEVMVEVQG